MRYFRADGSRDRNGAELHGGHAHKAAEATWRQVSLAPADQDARGPSSRNHQDAKTETLAWHTRAAGEQTPVEAIG